jgi:hypothetical protein
MKMNIVHRSDGSWDGKFVSPTDDRSTCTVMIVPPLKAVGKTKRVQRQEYQPPRVEELSESEDEGSTEPEEEN